MHMHTKERSFACSHKGCKKSFCDVNGLIYHQQRHKTENVHQSTNESSNPTISEAFHTQHRYSEEQEKTIMSAKERRPIRLRLSQPKKHDFVSSEDNPRKRILLRLPIKTTLGDSSTSDPKKAHSPVSKSNSVATRSTSHHKRSKVNQDVCPSNTGLSKGVTSEARCNDGISSHSFKHIIQVESHVLKSNAHAQALISQPAVLSGSAEDDRDDADIDRESSVHRAPVYTRVCGVYSVERASPTKAENRRGNYHCPRCDTQFTRPRSVLRHFVGCITKYGNPDGLKWTDHPSLHTVRYCARNRSQIQQCDLPSQAEEAKKMSRELSKDATLRSLMPKPRSSIDENTTGATEPACKPPGQNALKQKDIVQPIHKRRDALRRSKYNPETIARDVLLATGSHPDMDSLNAHLDTLRRRFRGVNLQSNMSSFRWDLVDPKQDAEPNAGQHLENYPEREIRHEREPEPERQVGQELEPKQSTPNVPKPQKGGIKSKFKASHSSPLSSSLRSTTKLYISSKNASFRVILPEKAHFGSMSTIFSSVFDRDPFARLMSSKKDLRAAILSTLESRSHEQKFMICAAFGNHNGVVGWLACHEVDTLGALPLDPLAYLDWMTATHLLPPQVSRYMLTRENTRGKTERMDQKKISHTLASTIQARATEAQTYLVPIRRLVINALVVHPSYQGRGVASALLKSITETMDKKKTPVWIQAPEDPAVVQGARNIGLFRRAGFTCAGELSLDLDSYTPKPRERSKGKATSFGTYKWNYMLRWPQPVRQKPSQRRSNVMQVSV